MRMVHYYLGFAVLVAPALLATLFLGIFHDGTLKHTYAGLFTSIGCVALNTLFIMFMIVTGRVLKVAMKARPLGPEALAELNQFFARKAAYPMAILAASLAAATAVLGHGRFIGIPIAVHMVLGLITVIVNLLGIPACARVLGDNQRLLDRVARELDRLDLIEGPPPEEAAAIDWRYGPRTRWIIFALSAWLPYLYWALVVWRGDFARVPTILPVLTAIGSAAGFLAASRSSPAAESEPRD